MNRTECLTGIVDSMDQTLQKIKEKDSCKALVPDSQYEKESQIENLKLHKVSLVYNSYKLQFNYQTRGFLAVVNSILDAGYEFDVWGIPFYVPAIYIMDYFEESIDDCFVFPQITNGEMMEECVTRLYELLKPIETKIGLLAKDDTGLLKIKKTMLADCQATIGYHEIPDDQREAEKLQLEGYCEFLKTRFTTGAFQAYLLGDCTAATKLFDKFKSYTSYEKKLVPLIEHKGAKALFPDSIRENILYYSNDSKKAGLRGLGGMLIGSILPGLFWTILFAAVYLGLVAILGRGQVMVAGGWNGIVMTILPGMVMGLSSTYYLRDRIYRVLYRKKYEKIIQMDYINNTAGTDRIMYVVIRIAFLASLIMTLLFSRDNVVFGSSGFWDHTGFWNMRSEYHTYYEIKRVVYQKETHDGIQSYMLYMKDGSKIDLSYYETADQLEQKVIPVLQQNDVTIEK